MFHVNLNKCAELRRQKKFGKSRIRISMKLKQKNNKNIYIAAA